MIDTWFTVTDEIKRIKREMESIDQTRQEAEQQASAAAIKMDVLASYFKDKERDLNRWSYIDLFITFK